MPTLSDLLANSRGPSKIAVYALQTALSAQVEREDRLGDVRHVAGVDVAYDDASKTAVGAAVVLDAQSFSVIESVTATVPVTSDYQPGAFVLREFEPSMAALRQLGAAPDLIICDGQGIAHPRKCGLACHLGLELDVPTIGCAKARLIEEPQPPGEERGDTAPLLQGDELLGAALRTQNGIKPVYVSTGHRVSLQTACDWVLKMSPRYRLPETTRAADQACRRALEAR